VSKSTKSGTRRQLSRAEIKAYEARRAAEVNRIGSAPTGALEPEAPIGTPMRRSYVMSRAEEFAIIRSDLRRLLIILSLLVALLIAATFVLR
jgi:hypothetical protein